MKYASREKRVVHRALMIFRSSEAWDQREERRFQRGWHVMQTLKTTTRTIWLLDNLSHLLDSKPMGTHPTMPSLTGWRAGVGVGHNPAERKTENW